MMNEALGAASIRIIALLTHHRTDVGDVVDHAPHFVVKLLDQFANEDEVFVMRGRLKVRGDVNEVVGGHDATDSDQGVCLLRNGTEVSLSNFLIHFEDTVVAGSGEFFQQRCGERSIPRTLFHQQSSVDRRRVQNIVKLGGRKRKRRTRLASGRDCDVMQETHSWPDVGFR